MTKIYKGHKLIGTGHIGRIDDTKHLGYHKVFHQRPTCEFYDDCNVSKIGKRDCQDFANCQVYKYFKRYGLVLKLTENKN